MHKYVLYRRGNGHPYTVMLRSDMEARKLAEGTTDVMRVETPECRVVWRRVKGDNTATQLPDFDMLNWFKGDERASK